MIEFVQVNYHVTFPCLFAMTHSRAGNKHIDWVNRDLRFSERPHTFWKISGSWLLAAWIFLVLLHR